MPVLALTNFFIDCEKCNSLDTLAALFMADSCTLTTSDCASSESGDIGGSMEAMIEDSVDFRKEYS